MVKCIHGVLFLMSFAALFSCGKLSVDDSQSMIPIDFSVRDYTAEVKGSSLTTDNISSFGVFALVNDSDKSSRMLLMDNVKVKDKGNFWAADEMYYWPQKSGTTVDFYAYSPYSATPSDKGIEFSFDETTGMPSFQFTMSDKADIDLMVAENEGCTAADGPVALNFRHLLSKVQFKFKVSNEGGFSYVVNQIKVKDVSQTGSYTWPEEDIEFNSSPVVDVVAGGGHGDYLIDTTLPVLIDDFTIYLPPGSFGKMEVTLNNELPQIIDYSDLILLPGKILTITMEIGLTDIQYTTAVTDWVNGGTATGDIS